MTRVRLLLILIAHVAVGGVLLGWAVVEDRHQREAIEQSLVHVASVLAGTLGPGLSAASNASREIEEVVTWRLLDNARLLAVFGGPDSGNHDRLQEIIEANGLDTVVFLDPTGIVRCSYGDLPEPAVLRAGIVRCSYGDLPEPAVLRGADDILSGQAEEVLLGSVLEAGVEHLAVAAATPDGGAVLVRTHATSARTFVRHLGVANLLERLVGAEGVLFLSYHEEPGDLLAEATWDGGPLPERATSDVKLHSVRDRSAFEVEIPVDVPAGGSASLRVGLDGAPLEQAAISGMRRTLLVGVLLAGYALAAVALAGVSRMRTLEKVESARRLAEVEGARRSSERLAAAGALAAGLAHEVRSPLNAISIAAQRMERSHPRDDDCMDFARRIRQEVRRLEGVLREFLEFARPVGDQRENVELSTLTAEVIELLRPEAESRGVQLELDHGTATVRADREAVHRSVINLLKNAIQASPQGSAVQLLIDRDANCGRLRIRDAGSGIDPKLADKIFEAFVTSRANGTGLGLSLVKRVAEEHGGSCTLANRKQGGAEACLRLPSAVEPSA